MLCLSSVSLSVCLSCLVIENARTLGVYVCMAGQRMGGASEFYVTKTCGERFIFLDSIIVLFGECFNRQE